MKTTEGSGAQRGRVLLFALSTCVWCRKAKQLLGELGVAYDVVDVDLLAGPERDTAMEEVRRWNPRCSFPTLVIDGHACIQGYDEGKIREALKS